MSRGPERIGGIPSGGPKAGPECGNCGACPLAGRCLRTTVIKFQGLEPIKMVTGVGEIIANTTDKGLPKVTYVFRPVDGGRPVSSEVSGKTCSQCGKNPNTCLHPERNYKAA